jgi:predicted phosphodiesterase
VGVIGDLHLPFERPDYLNFCVEIFDRCKCKTIVQIGDLVDFHAISFHEHNPDGMSAIDEMSEADKRLKRWKDCFPEMYICRGNHDRLPERQALFHSMPNRIIKSFREIWNFPSTWYDDFSWEIFGVRYMHGTGFSGQNAHIKAAESSRQSCVIGHTHSTLGGVYLVSERDRIFAVNTGCGIDRHTYAFNYGREFPKKPALGASVVTDKGKYFQCFAMDL